MASDGGLIEIPDSCAKREVEELVSPDEEVAGAAPALASEMPGGRFLGTFPPFWDCGIRGLSAAAPGALIETPGGSWGRGLTGLGAAGPGCLWILMPGGRFGGPLGLGPLGMRGAGALWPIGIRGAATI